MNDEKMEWQPIETAPKEPMGVLYFSETVTFWSEKEPVIQPQPHERIDVGYFDGEFFCYSMSNHEVFEFPEDINNPDRPTHWMPLPAPPNHSR